MLPDQPPHFRPPSESERPWHWTLLASSGAEVTVGIRPFGLPAERHDLGGQGRPEVDERADQETREGEEREEGGVGHERHCVSLMSGFANPSWVTPRLDQDGTVSSPWLSGSPTESRSASAPAMRPVRMFL